MRSLKDVEAHSPEYNRICERIGKQFDRKAGLVGIETRRLKVSTEVITKEEVITLAKVMSQTFYRGLEGVPQKQKVEILGRVQELLRELLGKKRRD